MPGRLLDVDQTEPSGLYVERCTTPAVADGCRVVADRERRTQLSVAGLVLGFEMTVRVRFSLGAVLVATLALGWGAGAGAQAGQLVLKPRWQLTPAWLGTSNAQNFSGPNSSSVVANSRYVAFVTNRGFGASWPTRPKTVLIDERTGKQRVLTRSPCTGSITIGGPWLMCTVSPVSAWLYNLRRGGWTDMYTPCPGNLCGQVAIGTYWVKIAWGSHSGAGVELVNIQTGSVIGDPGIAGGSISDDLNSPSGQQTLCPPLRYPGNALASSVTFYGRFALATGAAAAGASDITYLQACNSRLNLQLGAPWAASTNAVVWSATTGQAGRYSLQGVFLPSMRHFTIRLPRDLAAGISAIAISGHSLYVDSNTGHLWTAQLPARG